MCLCLYLYLCAVLMECKFGVVCGLFELYVVDKVLLLKELFDMLE